MRVKAFHTVLAIIALGIGITIFGIEGNGQQLELLKQYKNETLGLSFQYPSNWREQINDIPLAEYSLNAISFFITVPKLNVTDTMFYNASECVGTESKKMFDVIMSKVKSCDTYGMTIVPVEFNSTDITDPCRCDSLMDFVRWDYNRGGYKDNKFINDNETRVGNNHSAWQMESVNSLNETQLMVWSINDNFGYRIVYSGPSDDRFDDHLLGFRNMLKSVVFTPPVPEKKPSFLNSNETMDPSFLSSTPNFDANPVKILSSNDFIDSVGYLHVVGEIENNTPTSIEFVKVTGTFYDSNDQVVATDFTYTNPSAIGPGQKAPFELTLLSASIPVSQIERYNLISSYQ